MNIILLKEFESNDETVKLQVIETEKGLSINIKGETMDVFINGEEYYSKFDNPMYAYIPSSLRGFIEKSMPSYSKNIEKGNECVQLYLELGKQHKEYYVEISTKRAKLNNMIIRNDLYEYSWMQEDGIEVPNGEENYNLFVSKIKAIGYDFVFSHNAQDYYNYYQLVISIGKFDEEKIYQCIKLWENYNDYLEKTLGGR